MEVNLARVLSETMDTIDDLKNLPEDKRAELIEGEIQMMASPSFLHQKIVLDISYALQSYIKTNQGNCTLGIAPLDVYLDDENVFEPDLFMVCDEEKVHQDGCHGAPDFVVEVLSDSTRKKDTITKRIHYLEAGVREYWIVDPSRKTVMVFREDDITCYSFSDEIPVGIYDDMTITL